MRRTALFLLIAACVMLAVVWFADRPGHVAITWQGWRLDMSVGLLLAVGVGVAALAVALSGLWRFVIGGPRRALRRHRERRRRQGYAALTRGLVAVAAGDANEARRHARRADVLLDEPPLNMLLAASTAQIVGDEQEATHHFRRMLDRPETEFLGLRGLITQALKSGNQGEALELARRARTLRPRTGWVQTTLFDLETRSGDWRAAQETLRQAKKLGALPPALARRHEAAVALERSRQAVQEGRGADALADAEQAWKAEPDHAAVAPALAERYLAAGKGRTASRIIEQAWGRAPHGDLATLFLRAKEVSEPLARVKLIERLASLAPTHVESHLALARVTLDAKLWGEARRHLQNVITASGGVASAGVARLMARLEDEEGADPTAARSWLAKASEAPADSAWMCGGCGAAHDEWRALCGNCGAFDRIAWSARRQVTHATPILIAPSMSAAGSKLPSAGAAS